MVGGGFWTLEPAVKSQSEAHRGLAVEDTGDQDQEDALPLLLMCLAAYLRTRLSSLPLRRRAHLLLFSTTLSNVTTIHSQAGHDDTVAFPSLVSK